MSQKTFQMGKNIVQMSKKNSYEQKHSLNVPKNSWQLEHLIFNTWIKLVMCSQRPDPLPLLAAALGP